MALMRASIPANRTADLAAPAMHDDTIALGAQGVGRRLQIRVGLIGADPVYTARHVEHRPNCTTPPHPTRRTPRFVCCGRQAASAEPRLLNIARPTDQCKENRCHGR